MWKSLAVCFIRDHEFLTWNKCCFRSLKTKLMGMQAGVATLENSMEVPQKTKNRTTLCLSNCTTRHLSKGYRCAVLKGHMHPNVYSSTINNSQSIESTQMSIDGWMDKEDVVYIQWSITRQSKRMKSCHLQLRGWNWRVLCYVKLVSQRKTNSDDFTHMRTLRHRTDEHKGREAKII